jgi:hypothetical protein
MQLDTESKREMDRFLQFCKIHPNILTAFKIIGKYDLIITIERTEEKDILSEIRKNFRISDYRFFDIKNVLKSETVPDNVLE